MKIYLSGGARSDWQQSVKNECKLRSEEHNRKKFEFIDPSMSRTSGMYDEDGTWRLHFIKQSDIIFVFVEKENPEIIDIAVEMGYGKVLGKTIITVIEPGHNYIKDKYIDFLRCVSDIVFDDFASGLDYLTSFQLLNPE